MTISSEDVRALRERMRVSEAGLATLIGCNQSTVHRIEKGAKFGGVIEKAIVRLMAEHPPTPEDDAQPKRAASPRAAAQIEA